MKLMNQCVESENLEKGTGNNGEDSGFLAASCEESLVWLLPKFVQTTNEQKKLFGQLFKTISLSEQLFFSDGWRAGPSKNCSLVKIFVL